MSHLIFCFKTNRPGAWRIGGWGLRRRTRNGEYQVRGFLAPDIPNHCRQLKSFSKSSTGRETLRSGWSAVRNRSSSLVGAKVFELRFRIDRACGRPLRILYAAC